MGCSCAIPRHFEQRSRSSPPCSLLLPANSRSMALLPVHGWSKSLFCRPRLTNRNGSSCVSGGWREQQFNQRTQQCFAPFSNLVNELKEPQVKRQFLLRNPPVRSKPRPQQGPKALNRVDMDFAESIPILVAGELPGRVTHGVVGVAPFGQPTVNVIFLSVDNSSFSNRSLDQRGDCVLLHVWEHRDDNRAATLHHAEDRRFLLLQRSSAPFTLQPTAAPGPLFFLTSSGLPLCPATT